MRTFLICPVRNVDPSHSSRIVAVLEESGFIVHWPHRDTDQSDGTGLRICKGNRDAIAAADVVHIIWDGESQGCLFDLGMAFAFGKKVIPLEIPELTKGKSFQNMIQAWTESCREVE